MNKKGFTMMETIVAMYLLSVLIMVGMSLVQFTSNINFSEMRLSTTRAQISEHLLFIQRDFQSADKIFVSNIEKKEESIPVILIDDQVF